MSTNQLQLAILRALRLLSLNGWAITQQQLIGTRATLVAQKDLRPFNTIIATQQVDAARLLMEPLGWQLTAAETAASPISITLTTPPTRTA